MGTVYLAEQSEPVRRTVALKVLKADHGSVQILARFQAERQALAMMDHPSIAKIFDAGVTEDGRSYFAMERVEGSPLDEYCDEHRLSVRERVRLFTEVCHAVQHAHQKGLIHRDLKPSNVLVSEVDGRPLPKVIDFGIAKAVEVDAFDGTRLTRADQIIGTPAYMSPEQIDGSADIDTRSDIYSLGILLYVVLVGALPNDAAAYRGWAAVAAALHDEPPTLGQRLSQLSDTQLTLAELRNTSVPKLRKELAGDLDLIVSRAMEKDRTHRYETANGLALDLQRFLADEPVRARGMGTVYVLRKFARRNRVGVAFGATVAVGLIGFSVVTTIQAGRIARARDEAQARRGQAEGLIDFMLSDLRKKLEPMGRLDILNDVGGQATRYFASIPEGQFSDDELANRSKALYQVGSVRLDQGDSESAVEAFIESLRLARALSERAPGDPERLFGLSQSHFYVGYASFLKGDLEAAQTEFLGYLQAATRLVELDPANPAFRLELAFAHGNIGSTSEAAGDLTGAADAYALTLATLQTLVDMDSTNVDWLGELAETHNKLGVVERKRGDYARALEQHTLEVGLKERILQLAPEHAYWQFRSALALGFMAEVKVATGDLDGSLDLINRQVGLLDGLVLHDSSNTRWRRSRAMAERLRGEILIRQGQAPKAAASLGRAERELRALVAADSMASGWQVDLASVLTATANLHLAAGRPQAALAAAAEALGLASGPVAVTPARSKVLATADLAQGQALEALGRPQEAHAAWERSYSVVQPFTTGVDVTEFRPLVAEILLLLDRIPEANIELDALRASGYVDKQLERLADRKSALR